MRIYDEDEVQFGVQNDGMGDQQQSGQNRVAVGGSRPSTAKSNRERQERILLLKEKQDNDRLKKLEELKEQALAAARLREEQDSRRRKHFEELSRKEDERRRQAEERRRLLDEERKLALQAKWESKKAAHPIRPQSSKPTFAFGSCTPRLIDNHVDGFLWKSQYNLNVTREPGMRANSAQDLHLQQKEVRMSASMYEWNQQRTTIDNPLVPSSNNGERRQQKSRRNYDTPEAMRIFCGRRKTDLTPTIPIKREGYDMSASMMSRSTSRGSGRVYSSMTRLDRSRSPGGNLSVSQHQHQTSKPSRSKSTTHLASTGLKLTRTEVLRQALAAKKETTAGGFRSVDPSRPPSSMSSSIMTSSTHSQVQMRPRNFTRKPRPASVHVTGVSHENSPETSVTKSLRRRPDSSQERKSAVSVPPTTRKSEPKKVVGRVSPSPQSSAGSSQVTETSTMKRPAKKALSASKGKVSPTPTASGAKPATKETSKSVPASDRAKSKTPEPAKPPAVNPPSSDASAKSNTVDEQKEFRNDVSLVKEFSTVNENDLVPTQSKVVEVINNSKNENSNRVVGENNKVIENFESIESAFASGSDDFAFSSKTPEPSSDIPAAEAPKSGEPKTNPTSTSSAVDDLLGMDFSAGITAPPSTATETPLFSNSSAGAENKQPDSNSPTPSEEKGSCDDASNVEGSKPKIMTEEQAKAAIAEKRRLAREAAEREAARLAEEQRLEEERQRLEAEEAERLAREAREAEEERLRKAIEEQQKREEEERRKREEEEKAKQEKERQEREAAREAERVRLEMEERLKREEDERLERRKRVEAIMARTRKKEAEQNSKSSSPDGNKVASETVNGVAHKENNSVVGDNVQSTNNSLNNNYNNNNDFGNNSTLIEFDGMGDQGSNLIGDTSTGLISNTSSNNPIISNSVQDLLS